MKFDVETWAGVVNDASKTLKTRTLGGVEKGSAVEAIQKGVSKALNLGEEAVGKVQQELQGFKNKTAQEMAELTSKNDKIVFETKQAANKEIQAVKEEALKAVKASKAIKSSEKVLPNGNKEIRKVNKNGAIMVKEVTAKGVTVRSEVTTLAGEYRKTTYDPISGKPLKTFTDVNGDKLIEYKDGVPSSVKAVNNNKMKPVKPTLVNQTQPKLGETAFVGERAVQFDRIYSDGSKETINRVTSSKGNLERTKITGYDVDGKLVSETTSWPANNEKKIKLYDTVNNFSSETIQYDMPDGRFFKSTEKNAYDKTTGRYSIVSGERQLGDVSINFKQTKDEFGLPLQQFEAKITNGKGKDKQVVNIVGTRDEIFSVFNQHAKP